MKASVIILNYNGKDKIMDCIESVMNQNFPKDQFEIIVVDNNSTDGSEKLVEKYKEVKLIKRNVNDGFAKGNNVGIKASSGEYIALLNNDITLERDWLKKMVDKIESDKNIGILGCTIYYSYSGEIWNAGGNIFFPGFAKNLKLESEQECNWVAFAAMMMRRSVNELLDENLFMYYEDNELCKRVRKKGYKVWIYDNAFAFHHVEKGKVSAHEEYNMHKNRPYYYTKFYSLPGKILYLLGDLVLFFPMFALYRIIKNPKRIKFWKEILLARVTSIPLMFKELKGGKK